MFRGRSVIETMILAFTAIVVVVMTAMATAIIFVEITSKGDADTDRAVDGLMSLVSGILGALLGLIAGKTTDTTGIDETNSLVKPPPDEPPEQPPPP